MEEIKKQLYDLQDLTFQLDHISGLVYILREALFASEEYLNVQYTVASAYISDQLIEFEEKLDTLMEDMFSSIGEWEGQAKLLFGNHTV